MWPGSMTERGSKDPNCPALVASGSHQPKGPGPQFLYVARSYDAEGIERPEPPSGGPTSKGPGC